MNRNLPTCHRKGFFHRLMIVLFVGAWLATGTIGMGWLIGYSNAPGPDSTTVPNWPGDTGMTRSKNSATLLIFLHPKCPCSRASIKQLAKIKSIAGQPFKIQSIFYCPDSEASDWAHTHLWREAEEIAPESTMIDWAGREIQRFGVVTSGHVLLFDANGEQLYSGGITSSRGHEGDNRASHSVVRLLNGLHAQRTEFPVFGCPLRAEASGSYGSREADEE